MDDRGGHPDKDHDEKACLECAIRDVIRRLASVEEGGMMRFDGARVLFSLCRITAEIIAGAPDEMRERTVKAYLDDLQQFIADEEQWWETHDRFEGYEEPEEKKEPLQ